MKMVRQAQAAECGLACLAMVAAHHGHRSDLAELGLAAVRGDILPVISTFDCRMIQVLPTSREPMRSFVDRLKVQVPIHQGDLLLHPKALRSEEIFRQLHLARIYLDGHLLLVQKQYFHRCSWEMGLVFEKPYRYDDELLRHWPLHHIDLRRDTELFHEQLLRSTLLLFPGTMLQKSNY